MSGSEKTAYWLGAWITFAMIMLGLSVFSAYSGVSKVELMLANLILFLILRNTDRIIKEKESNE